MTSTFLTKEEVTTLTGVKFKSRQIAQLRTMGLPFWVNALGHPIIPRSAIDGRPSAAAPKPQPVKPVPRVLRSDYDGK
jgi:hypothetical protein